MESHVGCTGPGATGVLAAAATISGVTGGPDCAPAKRGSVASRRTVKIAGCKEVRKGVGRNMGSLQIDFNRGLSFVSPVEQRMVHGTPAATDEARSGRAGLAGSTHAASSRLGVLRQPTAAAETAA